MRKTPRCVLMLVAVLIAIAIPAGAFAAAGLGAARAVIPAENTSSGGDGATQQPPAAAEDPPAEEGTPSPGQDEISPAPESEELSPSPAPPEQTPLPEVPLGLLAFGEMASLLAEDRSGSVSILQVSITKQDGSALEMGSSVDLADYANGVAPYEYVQLGITLNATLSGGQTFANEDSFEIPMQLDGWSAPDTGWVGILDASGIVMGEWRIENKTVQIKLTDLYGSAVIGSPQFSATLVTGANYMRWGGYGAQDKIAGIRIGDAAQNANAISLNFKSNRNALNKRDQDWKRILSASNDTIQWYATLGQVNLANLWRGGGAGVAQQTASVADTLTGAIEVSSIAIKTFIQVPVTLNPDSIGISTISAWSRDVTSYFTRQDGSYPAQTFEEYQLSLPDMTYGVYTAADGTLSVAANYGTLGLSGPKYSDLDPDFAENAAASAIGQGYFQSFQSVELEQQFLAAYGEGNSLGGRLAEYVIYPTAKYHTVEEDTPIPNTAYVTIGSSTVLQSHTATLQGVGGSGGATPLSATIVKRDSETGQPVPGVTFKLQIESSPDAWEDFTPADGGGLLRTTDPTGSILFQSLGFGTYRFAETLAAPGYDITQSAGYDPATGEAYSSPFMIQSFDTQGQSVTLFNKKLLSITYAPGTQGTFAEDTHGALAYNTPTPPYGGPLDTAATNGDNAGNPTGNAGYRFTGWLPAPAALVTQNAVYVAQWEKVPAGGGTEPPATGDTSALPLWFALAAFSLLQMILIVLLHQIHQKKLAVMHADAKKPAQTPGRPSK